MLTTSGDFNMYELESATIQLDYMLNKILPVLERAVGLIPADRMDFKPNNKLNSITWLGYHALNGPYVYLKGVESNVMNKEIFNSIKLELNDIKDPNQLVEYAIGFNKSRYV